MTSSESHPRGEVVVVSLDAGDAAPHGGRSARALTRGGLLRATVITLAPGAELADHRAPGPITIQPLSGRLRFTAAGAAHELGPGELLAAPAGVVHRVDSAAGVTFLLTTAVPSGGPSEAQGGDEA